MFIFILALNLPVGQKLISNAKFGELSSQLATHVKKNITF